MDIRHLRYFVALWEARSFTRAAAAVHVAQSTLSHQIRQLEDHVGQPLVLRSERGVVGTPAGAQFYQHALHTLRSFDRTMGCVQREPAAFTGRIELGVTPTVNLALVPQAVAAFVQAHPSMQVHVTECSSNEVAEQVAVGRFDVGLAYAPAGDQASLPFEPLFDDELMLLVNPAHALAPRKRVRMADLHQQALVLQPAGCATRRLLDYAFHQAQVSPHVVVETAALSAIKHLVRHAGLAGMLSPLAVEHDPDLITVPIEGPTPRRRPGLLLRAGEVAPPVTAFCAALRERLASSAHTSVRRTAATSLPA